MIKNTNYRCYLARRCLAEKFIYLPLKTQKQPELGGRDYCEIKTAAHICICCATLFTRILQTMHYHFKAGQVRVSLVHAPHRDETLFVSPIYSSRFVSTARNLGVEAPADINLSSR